MNNSCWSTTLAIATDFFCQELQSHTNQYHFQVYLHEPLSVVSAAAAAVSATTLGLWRKLTDCQLTRCSKLDVIS